MSEAKRITMAGNEAAASVAFRLSETMAIFPITPSSSMAEACDEWASRGRTGRPLEAWMTENMWESLEEMRGNMSFQPIPNPAAYERETYRRFH